MIYFVDFQILANLAKICKGRNRPVSLPLEMPGMSPPGSACWGDTNTYRYGTGKDERNAGEGRARAGGLYGIASQTGGVLQTESRFIQG